MSKFMLKELQETSEKRSLRSDTQLIHFLTASPIEPVTLLEKIVLISYALVKMCDSVINNNTMLSIHTQPINFNSLNEIAYLEAQLVPSVRAWSDQQIHTNMLWGN